jgi:integrase/recombinase XerD
MRRSELLNLEPNHIDLKTNILRVEQAKGKKRREIPMTGKVREIMMALTPVLFRDMTKDQVTHKFTDCARGMGLKGMKLHSLRHTFGTYLIAMGYDITVAKELLGHEDIKTTMIYAKADTRLIRDAIRSFDVLENNGYKMVTKGERGIRKLLKKNPASSTGEPTIT